MGTISERELSLFIALLAKQIVEIRRELAAFDETTEGDLSDEDLDRQYHLHETLEQYENIVIDLRDEYEAGLVDGINPPSYDDLTKHLELQ